MTYKLTTKNIKSITLRVDKNGIVKVSAPNRVSKTHIDNFVSKHSEWILAKLRKIPKYADNEVIEYFGERYILQVRIAPKNSIIESQNLFGEKTLEITIKPQNAEQNTSKQIKKIIFKWYKTKSREFVESIIESRQNLLNRNVARITFREMTTKWGSCNYKRATISLNVALFKHPKVCFEYVLCHELAHLVHPNHQKGFYLLLDSLMPHWREAKKILKE